MWQHCSRSVSGLHKHVAVTLSDLPQTRTSVILILSFTLFILHAASVYLCCCDLDVCDAGISARRDPVPSGHCCYQPEAAQSPSACFPCLLYQCCPAAQTLPQCCGCRALSQCLLACFACRSWGYHVYPHKCVVFTEMVNSMVWYGVMCGVVVLG